MPDATMPADLAELIALHREMFGGFVMQADEPAAVPDQGGKEAVPTPTAVDFKPITSQDEFERALGRRLERERSKFADYDSLRDKAAKLDQIEEQNKTEMQRIAERAEAAERERDKVRAESLRWRVAAQFGISSESGPDGEPSDAELFLTGSDEETLTRQAQRLQQQKAAAVNPAPALDLRIDQSGRQAESPPSKDAAARAFFGL